MENETAEQAIYVLKKIIGYTLLAFFASGIALLIVVILKVTFFISVLFSIAVSCAVILFIAMIAVYAIVIVNNRANRGDKEK